jgi:hypothetical protein
MKIFILLFFVFVTTNLFAIEGSYKTFFEGIKNPNSNSIDGAFVNTFRPKITLPYNDHFSFHLAYALTANIQSIPLISETNKRDYRFADLNIIMSESPKANFVQNLDRLVMTYTANKLTLKIGRQPIAFGSAKIINPTDVLTPFSYQDIDKEERAGVDGVRMNFSLGDLSLLDAGVVLGKNFSKDQSAGFLRLKSNLFDTDISAIIMEFKNNRLVGLDLSRSISQASGWLEVADVKPVSAPDYLRWTLGFDYKFNSDLYSYFEYSYNGAGTLDPKLMPYLNNGISLHGVHYLVPGMNYELNPLWKLTGQFILNTDDKSLLSNVLLEHGLAQDIFIDIGTYLPLGAKSQLFQQSEFGMYPQLIYSTLRFYF